jgi:hypothetical protein
MVLNCLQSECNLDVTTDAIIIRFSLLKCASQQLGIIALFSAALLIFQSAAAMAWVIAADFADGDRLTFNHVAPGEKPLSLFAFKVRAFVVSAQAAFVAKTGNKLDFPRVIFNSAGFGSLNFKPMPCGLFGPGSGALMVVAFTVVGVGACKQKVDGRFHVCAVTCAH